MMKRKRERAKVKKREKKSSLSRRARSAVTGVATNEARSSWSSWLRFDAIRCRVRRHRHCLFGTMHTSRLRKKVEQADPGTYGNLNESFVSVGTALPSLASSSKKDLNDYKPLWEQEVFDEQGRKRLHGAFTGGFSAGYFNTVGSKEGESVITLHAIR